MWGVIWIYEYELASTMRGHIYKTNRATIMSVWTAGCSINTFYFLTLMKQFFLSPSSVLGCLYLWGRGQTRWTGGICWGYEAAPPSAPGWRSNPLRSHHRRSSWRTAGNTCEAKDCSICTHLVASWQQLIQPWLHCAHRKTTNMLQRQVTFSTGTHVTHTKCNMKLWLLIRFFRHSECQDSAICLYQRRSNCEAVPPPGWRSEQDVWQGQCSNIRKLLLNTCNPSHYTDTGDVWGVGGGHRVRLKTSALHCTSLLLKSNSTDDSLSVSWLAY